MFKKYWCIQLHYKGISKMDTYKCKYKKDINNYLKVLYTLGKLDNIYLISVWKKGLLKYSFLKNSQDFKNFLKI